MTDKKSIKQLLEEAEHEISTVTENTSTKLGFGDTSGATEEAKTAKNAWPSDPECYNLAIKIGRAANTVIYEATCIVGKKKKGCAVKTIDVSDYTVTEFGDLKRYIQTMTMLDHPNILEFKTAFPVSHELWVVNELMEGGSFGNMLRTQFQNGFSDEGIIATILYYTLQALHYIHGLGRVHRNVKAGHILLSKEGKVKLADFSMTAWLYGRQNKRAHSFVGDPSLCWMAPEMLDRALRKDGYGFSADIWSLGITTIELAEGVPPLYEYRDSGMKVIMSTVLAENNPPKLKEGDRKWSKSFKNFISSCLQKDPSKRPTAASLMKHSFMSSKKGRGYMKTNVYRKLTPLFERAKTLDEPEEEDSSNIADSPVWILPEGSDPIVRLAEKVANVVSDTSGGTSEDITTDTKIEEGSKRKKKESKGGDSHKMEDDIKKKKKEEEAKKKKEEEIKKKKEEDSKRKKKEKEEKTKESAAITRSTVDLLGGIPKLLPPTEVTRRASSPAIISPRQQPTLLNPVILAESPISPHRLEIEPVEVHLGEDTWGNVVVFIRTITGTACSFSLAGRALTITGTLPPLPVPPDVTLIDPFEENFKKLVTLPCDIDPSQVAKPQIVPGPTIILKIKKFLPPTKVNLGDIILT